MTANTTEKVTSNSDQLLFYAFVIVLYELVLFFMDLTGRVAVPSWTYFAPFLLLASSPIVALAAVLMFFITVVFLVVVLVAAALVGAFGWFVYTAASKLWRSGSKHPPRTGAQ